MKIAVIGTSNAILRGGYFDGIASHPAVTHAQNFSLGASTSVVLPKVRNEQKFDKFDYIVFDFALNEEAWARGKHCTTDEIEERFFDFISHLPEGGPRPVLALLPSLTIHSSMQVHELYTRLSQENGYPLVDGYRFLSNRQYAKAIEPDGVFMDADHMRRQTGHEFGLWIVERLLETSGSEPATAVTRLKSIPAYSYVLAGSGKSTNVMELTRRSSLISCEVVRITGGSQLFFQFEKPVHLLGLGLNIARSNAILSIRSDQAERLIATKGNHFTEEDRLVYVVTPFRALAGTHFTLTIPPTEPEGAAIEVIGITVRGQASERQYAVYEAVRNRSRN